MLYFFEYVQVPPQVNLFLKSDQLCFFEKKLNSSVRLTKKVRVSLLNPYLLKIEFTIPTPKKIGVKRTFSTSLVHLTKIAKDLFGFCYAYSSQISLNGVGFKVGLQRSYHALFALGFSHDILCTVPVGVTMSVVTETKMICTSFSHQKLMDFVSKVRRYKTPGSYDNRGVLIHGKESLLKKKKNKIT